MLNPDGNTFNAGKIAIVPLDNDTNNQSLDSQVEKSAFSTELNRASEQYSDKVPTKSPDDRQNNALTVVDGELPKETVDTHAVEVGKHSSEARTHVVDRSTSQFKSNSTLQDSEAGVNLYSVDGQLVDQSVDSPLVDAIAASDLVNASRNMELEIAGDVINVPGMLAIEDASISVNDADVTSNVPTDTDSPESAEDLVLASRRLEATAKSVTATATSLDVTPVKNAGIVNTNDVNVTTPTGENGQISFEAGAIVKASQPKSGTQTNLATTVVARHSNLESTSIAPHLPDIESVQNNTLLANNKLVATPVPLSTIVPAGATEISLSEISSKVAATREVDTADLANTSRSMGKPVPGQKSVETNSAATVAIPTATSAKVEQAVAQVPALLSVSPTAPQNLVETPIPADSYLSNAKAARLTDVGTHALPPSVAALAPGASDHSVVKANEVTISPQSMVEGKHTPGLTPVPVTEPTVTLKTAARESLAVERHNKLADVRSGIATKRASNSRPTIDAVSLQSQVGLFDSTSSNMYHVTTSGTISAISPLQSSGLSGETLIAPRTVLLDRPDADLTLVDNVRWAVNEKLSRASVNVTPANLGPITVNVDVENQTMSVSIITNSSAAKEAIDSLLPRMREHFASEGYQQVSVDVSSQQDRQGSARDRTEDSLDTEVSEGTELLIADVVNGEQDVKSTSALTGNYLIDTYV